MYHRYRYKIPVENVSRYKILFTYLRYVSRYLYLRYSPALIRSRQMCRKQRITGCHVSSIRNSATFGDGFQIQYFKTKAMADDLQLRGQYQRQNFKIRQHPSMSKIGTLSQDPSVENPVSVCSDVPQ